MKNIELDRFDARAHWYPVATSEEVRSGLIVHAFLDGQELALWRSADGQPHAWENRCPHRGTRFTLGRIIDNTLSCAYHGWRFANDTACKFIPANPRLAPPKSACAKAFGVHEEHGLLWATLGNAEWTGIGDVKAGDTYCRSFVVYRSPDEVRALLLDHFGEARIAGAGAFMSVSDPDSERQVLYLQPMGGDRTAVYLWIDLNGKEGRGKRSAAALCAAKAFKAIRARLEAAPRCAPAGGER